MTTTWSLEQLDQIPDVYRDFLVSLRPILDSEGMPMRIDGIPRGRVHSLMRMLGHPYEFDEIADVLKEAGLVKEDRLGFFSPTDKGRRLIRQMIGDTKPTPAPPLPPL